VVAALVAAQTSVPEETPEKPVPLTAAPVVEPKPAPRPTRVRLIPLRTAWLRLDVGATGGSEIEHGNLRFGALGRLGLTFSQVPLFAFGSGAYTVRGAGDPAIAWLTGSIGVGAYVGFAHGLGALDVRTEAALESVAIHASDGSRAENARRTRLGPRFGLDLSGYFAKNLAIVGGVEAAVLGPSVDIFVGGREVDRLPPFNWGFISAVRYDFR
jgi:hypothetical protein